MRKFITTLIVKWYRMAAKVGDARSQYNLALSYAKGEGVQQDNVEALKWYHLAANQGYIDAQFNLGSIYGHGTGVPQNVVMSYKWFLLAAALGDEEAKKALIDLNNIMESEQIAQAQKLAHEWKPIKKA